MRYNQNTFSYKTLQLHYHRFGSGENIIIAFHGFGQTGLAFKSIAEALGERITLYSFDLPFHGQSYWNSGENPIEKTFWKEAFEAFSEEKKIDVFSVFGFSLGCKFALATIELFPESVKEAVLLAPDGIKTNFWYALATYPIFLRKYFRSFILKPSSFLRIVDIMHKLKLMDRGILRFASSQMDTVKKRRKVYYSWVVFRNLSFDLDKIAALMNHHKISVTFYIGNYDKIITAQNIKIFQKSIEGSSLNLIDTGHNSLLIKVAEELNREKNKM